MELPNPDLADEPHAGVVMQATSISAAYTTRSYSVVVPESEYNDVVIEIRSSVLRNARQKISAAKPSLLFWIADILVAVSGICFGGWISYLLSTETYSKTIAFIFGTLLFGVGLATIIAYAFLKYLASTKNTTSISDALEIIPDPDKVVQKES